MAYNGPECYGGGECQVVVSKKRGPLSDQAEKPATKKSRTPAEIKTLSRRRDEEKEYSAKVYALQDKIYKMAEKLHAEYSHHATDKIYHAILQTSRKSLEKCNVSTWNAFQSIKVEELNKTRIDAGELKYRTHELALLIKESWDNMSTEEKSSVMRDKIEVLASICEQQAKTPQNSTLSAFHDASKNIKNI
ncbi:hypothetical protein BDY19DRAFT_997246 [Irpex rosettiformis]|uniref:Uncharacterized protein n=1 Tax=Irpex rosettiformis TaxID=378272 RepID=A0ACB8TSQ5_9APHY|nr:hypothetical protein BDY19DRAFT_997246 [Irpex rosettiformis]